MSEGTLKWNTGRRREWDDSLDLDAAWTRSDFRRPNDLGSASEVGAYQRTECDTRRREKREMKDELSRWPRITVTLILGVGIGVAASSILRDADRRRSSEPTADVAAEKSL
jgi:hypothetical protein